MKKEKIVIIITHGMGKQDQKLKFSRKYETKFEKVAKKLEKKIRKRFVKKGGDGSKLVFAPVNWAKISQQNQEELKDNLLKRKKQLKCQGEKVRSKPSWIFARKFMIDFLADAIVYQRSPRDQSMYNNIHAKFKEELKKQAQEVGENAYLCFIAHSLGTVIANNFLFDLQNCLETKNLSDCADTPLERGETLKFFFTFGSPLALWTIRHGPPTFGTPIKVETWINFYNRSDVIAYPLGNLNEEYRKIRCNGEKGIKPKLIDKKVWSGNLLTAWNPLCHNSYWNNRKVIKTIVDNLLEFYS
ncbi:MAG: hypothetical protein ACTSUR_04085 [Candidatus Heimdallarchaeaceae archaeon]